AALRGAGSPAGELARERLLFRVSRARRGAGRCDQREQEHVAHQRVLRRLNDRRAHGCQTSTANASVDNGPRFSTLSWKLRAAAGVTGALCRKASAASASPAKPAGSAA